jgi:hypothetical protein
VTSPTITFNLSSRATTDPWWVRLKQEDLPDDTATVSDAADLLDTLYNLDACDDSTETAEETEDVSAEEVTTTVEATVSAVSCLYDADGNVDVVVRVIRSRQDADYRLALVGGLLKTTETVRETVTQQTTLDNASNLTLDYPVIDGFTVQWRGQVYGSSGPIDSPKISRVGNTLDFGGVSIKAGTIRAEYLTEYDRCTVTILGKDGEPGECVTRAFFHGLVDELELQTPDAAEEIGSCTSHWMAPVSDDEVTCFRAVTKSYRCQCTDKEVYRETYDEITECPDYVTRCPGNARDCMHLLESITVPEYVGCSDAAEVTGAPGRIYALSTPEYYRDKCCEDPPGALPQCPERTTSWRGGLPIVGGAAKYYGMYGPKLRIVPVSPPGGICGTWKITQEIRSNNCCEGVEPLAWDAEVSPEIMTPNNSVIIGVTGGRGPYEWSVVGSGFQFQNGAKKIITAGNRIYLATLPAACGTAFISVTDGCSTAVGTIFATLGSWNDHCYTAVVTYGAPTYPTDWHYGIDVCADGCSFTIGSQRSGPAPNGVVDASFKVWHWYSTEWREASGFCGFGSPSVDFAALLAAIAQISANINVTFGGESGYPPPPFFPSAVTSLTGGGVCGWVC